MTKNKAMTTTWDNNSEESNVVSQSDENESSHEVGAFAALPEGIPKVFPNDCEEEKEEGEEDLQEAFDKLYLQCLELAKANKKLRKENKKVD